MAPVYPTQPITSTYNEPHPEALPQDQQDIDKQTTKDAYLTSTPHIQPSETSDLPDSSAEPQSYNKMTEGYMVQTFQNGNCTKQRFIAFNSHYEKLNGNPLTEKEKTHFHIGTNREAYKSFDQHEKPSFSYADCKEQIQQDLLCLLDTNVHSTTQQIKKVKDLACQIVIDNFNKLTR